MTESSVIEVLTAAEAPILVAHRHADRDSIGAAVGLAALLDSPTRICLPEGVAAPAQPLLDGQNPVETVDETAHDLMVVLDAPSTDRITPVEPLDPLVVIDHHPPEDLSELATARLVNEAAGSTAELVHQLARVADWPLSTAAAFPLVVGILADTGFLQAAGPDQIRHVIELLPHIAGREAALASLFDPSPGPGERNARIKGTARASFFQAGDVTFAITTVGGYEAAAAHALRDVGADCALVVSEQDDESRVVGRCSAAFADRLSLGEELLAALADTYGGAGGGHPTAGAAQLPATPSGELSDALERMIADALGMQFARLK